jgi:hypothetical protein
LGRLGDILHAPVKVDLSASDGKDQRDARDESRQIKPDQTKSNQIKPAGGSVPRLLTSAATREGVVVVGLFASYRGYFLGIARIKPDQGESNQIKRMKDEAAKPRHSRAVIPGQAGSNPIWALVLEIELRLEGVRTN